MKRRHQMWLLIFRTMRTILLIVGALVVLNTSVKILYCGMDLAFLHWDAGCYNSESRWTEESKAEFNQIMEQRDKYYQSKDWVVRTFSTSNDIIKLAIIFLALGMLVAVPISVMLEACIACKRLRKRLIKARARKRRNEKKPN